MARILADDRRLKAEPQNLFKYEETAFRTHCGGEFDTPLTCALSMAATRCNRARE